MTYRSVGHVLIEEASHIRRSIVRSGCTPECFLTEPRLQRQALIVQLPGVLSHVLEVLRVGLGC